MPYAVSLTLLGCYVLATRVYVGRWVNGVSAFTGVWLASLLVMAFRPDVWVFVTWHAVALIAIAHLMFLLGYLSIGLHNAQCRTKGEEELKPTSETLLWAIFWLCLLVSGVGAFLQLATMLNGRVLDVLVLSTARDDLFTGEIFMPLKARIAANFSYSAIALGTVLAHRTTIRKVGLLCAVGPLFTVFIMSIACGGRGPVLIGFILFCWTASSCSGSARVLQARRKIMTAIAGIVFAYVVVVAELRATPSGGIRSVQEYFIGSIPALSVWLNVTPYLPSINFDLSGFAPAREILSAVGHPYLRSIDIDSVYIPYGFNVYTSFAEYLASLGWAGTVVLCALLGCLAAFIETYMRPKLRPAMLGLIYTYLSWSLISDLSFLLSGWSLAVALVASLNLWGGLKETGRIRRKRSSFSSFATTN